MVGGNEIAGMQIGKLIPFHALSTRVFDKSVQEWYTVAINRSINTIQSAISLTHDHVEGIPLGKHAFVSKLLKGIYNSRQPHQGT